MEKTCGNCGWVTSAELNCHFAAGDGRYYGRFTRPDAKPCEHWIEAKDTLDQRYQQLAGVARGMLKEIKTMAGSYGYTADLDYEHKIEWIEDCVRPWRKQLEELGVEL